MYLNYITALILFVGNIQAAYAYLDPGTGSIIIQSVIAAIAAAAMVIKVYWYRIKTFFSRASQEVTDETGENTTQGKQDSST